MVRLSSLRHGAVGDSLSLSMPDGASPWRLRPTAIAPNGKCSAATEIAFLAALRAISFAFAVMLAEVIVVSAVLLLWEELKIRARAFDLEKKLLNSKWIAGVSRERDLWEVEECACLNCSPGRCGGMVKCVRGALVPRYIGPKQTTSWNGFVWRKILSIFSHRGRVSILFAIANAIAMLSVIVFLPGDFSCGSGSLQKQSAADVFVLLGTEAALSLVLLIVTLVLFVMGLPSPSHARQTILLKEDAKLVYALMGLELVDGASGGPSEGPGGEKGRVQFVFSRAAWRSTLVPPPEPETSYFVRRLHVLGRLLKHLQIYEEVMLLLYPWPRAYMRHGWEIKNASEDPTLAKDKAEDPPPSSWVKPSPRYASMMNLDGLRRTVRSSGEWTEFVVRFWNKTQAGGIEVRNNNMSAFVPTEVEVATLIMKRILDLLDVLPQPQDLFFSLVTSLTVTWVITFIALFGDYDGTVFGVLYGGAQVTAFSGFWYFAISVQWQKATPRGYIGNRVRQVLDDIDCELAHCKLTDGDDQDDSIYAYWPSTSPGARPQSPLSSPPLGSP